MALTIFKLEKFKITGYDTADRNDLLAPTFEAQYNPTSFYWNHDIKLKPSRTIGASGQQQKYAYTEAPQLSVTLTLDGTNVDAMGLFAFTSATVKDRVATFKKVAYTYRGKEHEPPYLRVSWGTLEEFDCRLSSFKVTYTLFDRDATPLRAEIAAKFRGDISPEKMAKLQQNSSPDLTHSRTVRLGDTLPLLTRDIYGSAQNYLDVARFNGLDDFRELTPGQEILFPPLVVFAARDNDDSNSDR